MTKHPSCLLENPWIQRAKRKKLCRALEFLTRQKNYIAFQSKTTTRLRHHQSCSFFFLYFLVLQDRPLPPHLWVFLFPTGVQLEEHSLPPRFFVNALTYSDGTRSYVIAIKFYEKTGWQLKKTGSSTRTRSTSINVKKGIDVL